MADHGLPSVNRLRQLLEYDAATGVLTWRWSETMPRKRNTRFAGKPALTATHRQGYHFGCIDGRHVYAHRVAWALHHGEWPSDQIDHINHDRADNRIANLRAVSKSQNMRNMPKLKNNTSGVTGVYQDKRDARWTAYIRVDRRLLYLGRFREFNDAVAARKAAEARYGFHANHGVEAQQDPTKD